MNSNSAQGHLYFGHTKMWIMKCHAGCGHSIERHCNIVTLTLTLTLSGVARGGKGGGSCPRAPPGGGRQNPAKEFLKFIY